ncbi:hypothetical protein GALMADRAFT_247948 [Galerina marginata CBS 339.88]|uniref:F-box domain-containing protein n=1 Tax=Galerina marginata (strain CBS 339.88) TaxID=685588 RepID=A0A067SZN8_GALM3|nr:hypothetical protein GALMADRAFT_247948 [Galerina marginata CBS 339.88]
MDFTLLPQELIALVVKESCSDPSTLNALVLTCKRLHKEANPVLYASMVDCSETIQHNFLSTIQKNRELATLVRVYVAPTNALSLRDLIIPCLSLMVNLQELTIIQTFFFAARPFPLVLGQEMPFQLKKFASTSSGGYRHANNVAQFLENQHELTHLHWLDNSTLHLSKNACPRLQYLFSNLSSARAILPQRSIVELYLHDGDDPRLGGSEFDSDQRKRDFSQLEEVGCLRALSLDVEMSHSVKTQEFFIQPSRNMVVLRSDWPYNWESLGLLDKFSSLKRLIINTDPSMRRSSGTAFDLEFNIPRLFIGRSNLRIVDALWEHPVRYKRWVDGVPQPGLIGINLDSLI